MNETEAKEFADEILSAVFKSGQWCDVEYKYRGKKLNQIKLEVSIKIKK